MLLSTLLFPLRAQTGTEQVLESIRQKNTTLNALREKAKADKIGNRTGLTRPIRRLNSQSMGYPQEPGDEDLSITQTFDFTCLSVQQQLSKGQNGRLTSFSNQKNADHTRSPRTLYWNSLTGICKTNIYETLSSSER
jgi:hypothetical protein